MEFQLWTPFVYISKSIHLSYVQNSFLPLILNNCMYADHSKRYTAVLAEVHGYFM
jgi:hypothetical protein